MNCGDAIWIPGRTCVPLSAKACSRYLDYAEFVNALRPQELRERNPSSAAAA
jgi:hypothetical protein